MVRGTFQLRPRTKMKLLHSNIWWSEGVELLEKGIDCARGLHLYRQGIRCVDDVWDSSEQEFLTWEKAQRKFKLTDLERGNWEEVVHEISRYWRHLLVTEKTLYTPVNGWDSMWGPRKTRPWSLDVGGNSHLNACKGKYLHYHFRCNVTRWALTLDA